MNLALMNKEEEEEEILIDVSELPGSLGIIWYCLILSETIYRQDG